MSGHSSVSLSGAVVSALLPLAGLDACGVHAIRLKVGLPEMGRRNPFGISV